MKNIIYIPIDKLHPHPDNPRKSLGNLTELADSIKATGVLQNLTVVPWFSELTKRPADDPKQQAEMGYRVVIGHRRMAAARLAGLTELPCVIAEIPYKEQLATMLLENMQRSDLTVYEQAEGFQLMMDLGESVLSISEKTGFSESTVRRRLKMTELDRNTLKEVAERQIELKDFDRLAQIEDLTERNALLKSIGTPNFNIEVERKLKKQTIDKVLPAVKKELRKAGSKKIEPRQTWYGDYEEISGTEVKLQSLDMDEFKVPESNEQVYYCLQKDIGRLRFYTEKKRAAPKKRPQEEIDREKAIKAAHAKCMEISELSRKLREDFVKELRVTSKNSAQMLEGAATVIAFLGVHYGNVSSETMYRLAGVKNEWKDSCKRECVQNITGRTEELLPQVIYAGFCDINEYYHTTYQREFPEHTQNIRLDLLYGWLTSLGYVMSDDEKAMQDGTHEIFKESRCEADG